MAEACMIGTESHRRKVELIAPRPGRVYNQHWKMDSILCHRKPLEVVSMLGFTCLKYFSGCYIEKILK